MIRPSLVRRLAPALACVATVGGGGATQPPAPMLELIVQPGTTGTWDPPQTGYLICRLPVRVVSTAPSTLVLTGATWTLVAPYGSYTHTWTQTELAGFLGADHVGAGQTLTGSFPVAGLASFAGKITLGESGSINGSVEAVSCCL